MESADETIPIQISEDPAAVVQVGANLSDSLLSEITSLLKANLDLFALKPSDMTGIDRKIAEHRLEVRPDARPVRQKRRPMAPERQQVVDEEINKLLAAGFIREVHYPEWLANVVLVEKTGGKWRMCIDFKDLNKACPKDCYPLPCIDQLVDSTSGHELLSFMDAFSGYHQIKMARCDEEKTSFTTHRGTYCYTAMPFGLKNAGATYQRLVNKMFEKQIGQNMEVYVDDMLVKSKQTCNHVVDLREAFASMRRYNMKLNPQKCVFGISAGKFLGFMVSQRGIEANPQKIRAIQSMAHPESIKQVQQLAGKIASLHRFISKSADKCLPLFQLLRKKATYEWDAECAHAFEELKLYLQSPPLLAKPELGETLQLYLAVSASAISSVLTAKRGREQRPIYYVSKTLTGAEFNYPPIEKLAFALIVTSRKLRHYFQSHRIQVLTDFPLRQSLHKPEMSGRLIKWTMELSQFDIEFLPRTAIKAQALADFVAEFTNEFQADTPDDRWTLHTDGSSCQSGGGIGIVLKSPDNHIFKYAIRLEFKATNNVAEYEALLNGLKIARHLGAKHLVAFTDSALVTKQISGQYEAKDSVVIKYLAKVQEWMLTFRQIKIQHVPRSNNTEADALSKLASSGVTEQPILVEIREKPSIEEERLMEIGHSANWMTPIVQYIRDGTLPENKAEARALIKRSVPYVLDDQEVLYRRSRTHPYQVCISPEKAQTVLAEIHSGNCGDHAG